MTVNKKSSSSLGSLFTLALILSTVVAVAVVNAATITKITPYKGSLLGGTRLTVLGTGFDMRGRSNDIFIGSGVKGSFCDPIPNECTVSRIVCLTDVTGEGTQPLSVRSFGFLAECKVSRGCTFEYTAEQTPEVTSVKPEWITNVPSTITVSGRRFSQGDPTVAAFDFTLHLGEEERAELVGAISYSSFKANIHSMRPGTLPMDLVHGASGRAKWSTKNTLLVMPTINKVEPVSGSINGGTVITLFGSSFSPVLAENEIRVHGRICPALFHTSTYITCRTGPNTLDNDVAVDTTETSAPTSAAPWQRNKVLQEFWFNLPGGSVHNDWYTKIAYLTPHQKVMHNSITDIARTCYNCAVRTTFYWYAPETGVYNFSAAKYSFDDEGEFWISTDETPVERAQEEFASVVLDVTPFNSQRVLAAGYYQTSKGSIELNKGWHWCRFYLKQGGGSLKQKISILYPNGTTSDFSDLAASHVNYREPYTPPVAVKVRGVQAHFADQCGALGSCRFDYRKDKTPTVVSVTPNSNVASGTEITITGTLFDQSTSAPDELPTSCANETQCGGGSCSCSSSTECNLYTDLCDWNGTACNFKASTKDRCNTWSRNDVTICGRPCYVKSLAPSGSLTTLKCTVGYGITAGSCPIEIQVGDYGKAASAGSITVQPTILAVYPTTGFTTGGNLITISGYGFDPTPGATTVTIGGNACELPKTDSSYTSEGEDNSDEATKQEQQQEQEGNSYSKLITYYRIKCIAPSGSAGAQSVVVSVRGQTRAVARDVFHWTFLQNRPGTTRESVPVTISPMKASLTGVDRIVISASGRSFPEDADITVKFDAYDCPVFTKSAETIVCEAPQLSAPMKKAADVIIKHKDSGVVLHSFKTPVVDFNNKVTSMTRWMNPNRGQRVTIDGHFQPARLSDLSVSVGGQTCKNIHFDPYWNDIQCDVPAVSASALSTLADNLPTLHYYNFAPSGFTDVLQHLHNSENVVANSDSTATIPSGSEYLITKRRFKRPFAFEATIRPTTTVALAGKNARITMRFCVQDPHSDLGYHASVGTDKYGRFALGRDYSRTLSTKEYTGSFANLGVDPSSPIKLRVEAYNEAIRFLVNGVEAGIIRDRVYLDGKVGFGFSKQNFRVGSFLVQDLYPLSTQVNISKVPARMHNDALFTSRPPQVSSMPIKTSITKGSKVIMYLDRWVHWTRRVLALRSADEQPTEHTPQLCTGGLSRTLSGKVKFTCTATGNLAAGNYHWLFTSDYDGAATQTFSGSYAAKMTSVSPSSVAQYGSLITVSGYGFTEGSAVTVSGKACTTLWRTQSRITCQLGAMNAGGHAVKVTTNGIDSVCSGCSVSVTSQTTPTISGVSPNAGTLPRALTITGANFASGSSINVYTSSNSGSTRNRRHKCDTWSKNSAKIVVWCSQADQGSQSLYVHFTAHGGLMTTTYTVHAGAADSNPAKGSTHGGTRITIRSNALPAGTSASTLGSKDFANGAESSWYNSPAQTTKCGDLSILGIMKYQSLWRSFSSLPTHAAIKVSYKVISIGWQRMELLLGSKSHILDTTSTLSGTCMGDTSTTYVSEGWIILPHTSSSVTVKFSNGGASGKWGLASYSVEVISSLQHVVRIGGNGCTLSSITPQATVCESTPGAGGSVTSKELSLTVNGVEYCNGCTFSYEAAETPTISNLIHSNLPGIQDSDTKTPQFASHENVKVHYEQHSETPASESRRIVAELNKPTGGNSWSYSWFFCPFALHETDAAVNGFSVQLNKGRVMIGLTSQHINDDTHNMLDFGLYFDGNRLTAYRRGNWANSLEFAEYGDTIHIAYYRDCGCVRAGLTPKGSAISHTVYSWKSNPSMFPLYAAGTMHDQGASLKNVELFAARSQRSRVVFYGTNFKNFPAATTPDTSAIKVAGSNCLDVYVSNDVASCWLAPGIAGQSSSFNNIRVRGKSGFSQTTGVNLFTTTYTVSAPSHTTGSTAGGHVLSFTGSGFTAATTVTISGTTCTVFDYSSSHLKCKTGAKAAASNQAITVSTGGNTHTCIKFLDVSRLSGSSANTCVYTYDASSTPSITSGPAGSTVKSNDEITLAGTGFITSEKPVVTIGSASTAGKEINCVVTSYTDAEVKCTVGTVVAGDHPLSLTWTSAGAAANGMTLAASLSITTIDPASMSTGAYGNSTLTFTGTGFGVDGDSATPITVKIAGTDLCQKITRKDSQLLCLTSVGAHNGAISIQIGTKTVATGNFQAAGANAPTVSSFSPTSGGRGTTIVITGSNIDTPIGAMVGDAPCNLIQAVSSNTKLVCMIVGSITSGANVEVSVISKTRGRSAGVSGFTGALAVFAPKAPFDTLPFNSKENTNTTILGNGFGTMSSGETIIARIGKAKCEESHVSADLISQGTGNSILCVVNSTSGGDPENHDIDVTVIKGSATTASGSASYTYDASITSTITSISPTSGSAAGMEQVTVSGTGFSMVISDMDVRIGGVPCYVTETVSATECVCLTQPMPFGASLAVSVVVQGQGRASGSVTFASTLQIDSISSSDVSVEGGLVLTITGSGFWEIPDKSSWKYNRALLNIGNRPCPVVSSTKTQLKCKLRATEILPRVKLPTLVSSYVLPPEEIGSKLSFKLNNLESKITNSALVVNYRHSSTPRITSVSTSGSAAAPTVTIVGTNFAANANTVEYASAPCTISSESNTQIICNVESHHYHSGAPVRVNVPALGLSAGFVSCSGGKYLTCDGTCLSDSNCVVGDWGMSTCSALANLIMSDAFCHSNGGTDRVGIPFRSDDGTVINFNCPMYSCEGGDCDSYLTIGGIGARINTCGANPSGPVKKLAPTVSSLSATSSSIYGGLLLTISGSNFPSSNTSLVMVSIGGGNSNLRNPVGCAVVSTGNTQVVCRTSATGGTVSNAPVNVYAKRVLSTSSKTINFVSSSIPVITSVSPSSFVATDKITVSGTGFSSSAKVLIGNKYCTNVVADASQVKCDVPHTTSSGSTTVKVEVPGIGYSKSVGGTMRVGIVSVSPNIGSTAGGTYVTVIGSSFDKTTRVRFGSSCNTDFVSFTESTSTLVVKTQACAASTQSGYTLIGGSTSSTTSRCKSGANCRFSFSSASTHSITLVQKDTPATGQVTIHTSNVASNVNQAQVSVKFAGATCSITSFTTSQVVCSYTEASGGTFGVLYHINPTGYASGVAQFSSLHTISSFEPTSGSLGGGQKFTVHGTGFPKSVPLAMKINIGIQSNTKAVPCDVESVAWNKVICTTRSVSGAFVDKIVAQIDGSGGKIEGWVSAPPSETSTSSYTYDASISPTVTSIEPHRGSTAGGTVLTIVGTGLSTALTVTINKVTCTQTSAQQTATTSTSYLCTTGNHSKTMMEPAKVIVAGANNVGNAISTSTYQYVDLWSRFTTWGNTPPPIKGDSVVISEGQTVMVDYSPPRFNLVIVMGHLMFDPTSDIQFECTYIMINYGRFSIGTPEKPYLKRATITLFGDRLSPEIPVHGAKVLALRHGALDMHGEVRQPTWTHLAYTARAGGAMIFVKGPIDWRAGEFVVVASTDFHHEHTERRMIVGVFPADGQTENVTLTLEYPLKYEHYGERQCFGTSGGDDSLCINEVAEVGLLTRNIVIQGERNSMNIGFGGTMFLMPMGETADRYARLSYVEFRMVGQEFIVGRYPVHFHVTGSANNSYVNGTSVHQSLNRAFSIHGVNNNTYVNNVATDVRGHCFFIEDGSEKFNVIDNNFVSNVKTTTSNLNTDITPANFWIVSASNKVTNNAAGGGDAYGFWIAPFHPHSTGPTYSPDICPASHKLWAFHHNVAHSNHKHGVNIFRFWWPKKVECDFNSEDEQAVLHDITVYKNQIWGITLGNQEVGSVGAVIFDKCLIADNGFNHPDGAGFWIEIIKARNMTNGLRNAVIIANTNNQPNTRRSNRRGVNLAKGDNFFVQNVTFVNFDASRDFGFEPQAWAARMSLCFPYGWEAVTRQLSWVNAPNRVLYRFHHHGVLNDDDGTLADSSAESQLITKTSIIDTNVCRDATITTKSASVVCPKSYKIRRFGPSATNEIWQDQVWNLDGRKEIVPVITRAYIMTAPVNSKINISFQAIKVPDVWDWKFGGKTFMQTGEKQIFQTQHNESRHHVYVLYDGKIDKDYKRPAPTLTDTTNKYGFNNETGEFSSMIVYPSRTMTAKSYNCPEEGCPLPPLPPGAWDKPCKPYNVDSSWDAGVVPETDLTTDIMINNEESLCLGAGFGGQTTVRTRGAATICQAGSEYEYSYRNIRIEGALQFRDEHCPCDGAIVRLKIAGNLWMRQGGIIVGNATHKLTRCNFQISMLEPDWQDQAQMAQIVTRPWGSRSIILESGMFMLNGKVPSPMYARLASTARAGSNQLFLDRAAESWTVGDTIQIADTQRRKMFTKVKRGEDTIANGKNQGERRRIVSMSSDKRMLTLDSGLRFEHYGSPIDAVGGAEYQIGAEVAIINRNIVIDGPKSSTASTFDTVHRTPDLPEFQGGWALAAGCTQDNYEGCAVYSTAGFPMEEEDKPGYIRLEGVLMRDPGQGGLRHGAIDLDGLVGQGNDARQSFMRHNVIDRALNSAIVIRHTTERMRIEHNLIIDPRGDGIMALGKNNSLYGNLIMGAGFPMQCEDLYDIIPQCRTAGIRTRGRNKLYNNIVAGHLMIGILTDGELCNAPIEWDNNYVHSNRDGVVVMQEIQDGGFGYPSPSQDELLPTTCRKIGGVMAYWNGDHGFAAWYAPGGLILENFKSVENTIGIASLLKTPNNFPGKETSTATYRNLVVAGFFDTHQCRSNDHHWKCTKSLVDSSNWCNRLLRANGLNRKIGTVGILETVFSSEELNIKKTKGEKKFRWEEPDTYAPLTGQAFHENITFANYDGSDSCGLRNVAFHNNIFSNDTFKHHLFKGIKWTGTVQNGGQFWASRTYGDAQFPTFEREATWYLDYDNSIYGTYWPDAPNKNLIIDQDGTFTGRTDGRKSSIVADESMVRPTTFDRLRYDGRAFRNGNLEAPFTGCEFNKDWNAHLCDNNFEWMSLTIDSLAEDSLTRRSAPAVLCTGDGMPEINGEPLCQGGGVQYASGPLPKGKVQRATLDRLTRFKFHALDRANNTLSFRGSPPAWMRLLLHDHEHTSAGSGSGVTLNLRYFGLNSQLRIGIYVDGVRLRPSVGYGFPWDMSPAQTWPGPRDAAGTHFHNKLIVDIPLEQQGNSQSDRKQYNVMSFTIRPGKVVELKVEEIVQITMDVSMPLEQFFTQKDTFVVSLALVLGIDSSRLKFANIVAGSTLSSTTNSRRAAALTANSNTSGAAGGSAITIDTSLRPGDAQTSYNTGNSVNDFDSIVTAAHNIDNTVGSFTVSNVQATILKPVFPVTPVRVTYGTPYIACNSTKNGVNINATEMQLALQDWYLTNKDTISPYNETEIDEVGASNVWHNRDDGWSQVVFSLGYEDNVAIRDGLQFIWTQLKTSNATAHTVFPNYQFRQCRFELNGWCDGCANDRLNKNFAMIFGLALGLSLLVLIAIGIAVGYYYFYVRPRQATKELDKEGDIDMPEEFEGEGDEEHPSDQYDENGKKYWYDEDGQPYYIDEESGQAHYYYDTHTSEAPMFDETGKQFWYSEEGQPYYLNEEGEAVYYYDEETGAQ